MRSTSRRQPVPCNPTFFISAGREPQPGAGFLEGVPDLIAEVLSPSTVRTDRLVKFDAYERAGVREYWIVNPDTHTVEIYVMGDVGIASRQTMAVSGKVPSGWETRRLKLGTARIIELSSTPLFLISSIKLMSLKTFIHGSPV